MDEFLAEFERALSGTPRERADMVATMRSHLQDAADAGKLDVLLDQLGPPNEVAARFVASGAGHRHHDAVMLPSGTAVWASSFPRDGYERVQPPDFGLYLDPRWQPPWPHAHVDWADFGLPSNHSALVDALDDLLSRAQSGTSVEVGCLGGHGRTGTALACLTILAGVAQDPVQWVRSNYCQHAVETEEQAEFVRQLYTTG